MGRWPVRPNTSATRSSPDLRARTWSSEWDETGASRRFTGNLEAAAGLLARSGCRMVNALYGNRLTGYDPDRQDRTALDRIATVASRVAALGGQVVVETLNHRDSPDYPLTDIAVIKIEGHDFPSIPWGDSTKLEPGQTVLAFGNPYGFRFSVTRGIISALNRSSLDSDRRKPGEFIQTNIIGTFTLLQEALRHWRKLEEPLRRSFRFLHVSTDEVFGVGHCSFTTSADGSEDLWSHARPKCRAFEDRPQQSCREWASTWQTGVSLIPASREERG